MRDFERRCIIRRSITCAAAAVLAAPRIALAHAGRAIEPHDLWASWNGAPVLLVTLVIGTTWYALGLRALWRRAGRGRGVAVPRAAAFFGGMLALVIALVSPVDALGGALFSAHMVQHLLLVVVAAPLILLGEPQYAMLWALRKPARRTAAHWWRASGALRSAWRALSHPPVAWTLHVAALWLWHVPSLYDAALRDERVHVLEHTTYMMTALLFWWVVLDRRRLGIGGAAFYLFTAALSGTLLGALLSIARQPWYSVHFATTQPWGYSPLEDQQLAGLIMWIPAGFAYLVALLTRFVGALRTSSEKAPTRIHADVVRITS